MTNFEALTVGDKIKVERQAIYTNQSTQSFKVTTKTITAIRSIDENTSLITWGKGKEARSFQMSLNTGSIFGNYCNRPTRYQIIEIN